MVIIYPVDLLILTAVAWATWLDGCLCMETATTIHDGYAPIQGGERLVFCPKATNEPCLQKKETRGVRRVRHAYDGIELRVPNLCPVARFDVPSPHQCLNSGRRMHICTEY